MIFAPLRYYRPTGPDRVAVVGVEPAFGSAGAFLIRLARGPKARQLTKGSVFGPYLEADLPARIADLVVQLEGEGFTVAGHAQCLSDLAHPLAQIRARAAARLGWYQSSAAVEPLIAALPAAVDDACALLDALGAIGDPRAIPIVRDYATRKLLSRRRSAVEALRNLNDAAGLADAVGRAVATLPASVLAVFTAIDPADASAAVVEPLAVAVQALDLKFQGLTLDTLYEIGTPAAVGAVRLVLSGPIKFGRAFLWRYVKSIHKRALLRFDLVTFGWLSHAIEVQARGAEGTTAVVKSGYDGVERPTAIFRQGTQNYVRRLNWRYLQHLAKYRPTLYAHAAAEAVVAYTDLDAEEPRGLRGEFARCYLLHRILFGASPRFRLDDRRLTFRFVDATVTQPPADAREEAWSELWDAEPTAYLRVLTASKLPAAHPFAVRALTGPARSVLASAFSAVVLALLRAPYEPTVQLGLAELDRRFDPERPDFVLLDLVLMDVLPRAQGLGRKWLRRSAPRWTQDRDWLVTWLCFPNAETAALAAELALPTLAVQPEWRQAAATRLLALLKVPEASPGTHDIYARVAIEALADEVGALLTLEDLIGMITAGHPPIQALAGSLLARRPEAIDHLGLEGLVVLAEHEVALVRAAAQGLIRSEPERFWADLAPLFLLVESDWADTRALAFDLLRHAIGLDTLGPDGVLGLLDSNRPDVQNMGRELARKHVGVWDPRFFMERLVEHPHPNLRRFALDLVVEHLPAGAVALCRLEAFFRSAILDLRPDRLVKRRVIDFLLRQGRHDAESARIAARLLGEFVRLDVRADAEHALEAIVRLNLIYPGLDPSVAVQLEGVA